MHERKLPISPTTVDTSVARSVAAVLTERHPLLESVGDRQEEARARVPGGPFYTRCCCCCSAVRPNNIPDCVAPKLWDTLQGDPGTVDTEFTPDPVTLHGGYIGS